MTLAKNEGVPHPPTLSLLRQTRMDDWALCCVLRIQSVAQVSLEALRRYYVPASSPVWQQCVIKGVRLKTEQSFEAELGQGSSQGFSNHKTSSIFVGFFRNFKLFTYFIFHSTCPLKLWKGQLSKHLNSQLDTPVSDMKRNVENTPRCTRLNCILARRSSLHRT